MNQNLKVRCFNYQKSLLFILSNNLHVNKTALSELGLERESVSCYYQYIKFISEEKFTYEQRLRIDADKVELREAVQQ